MIHTIYQDRLLDHYKNPRNRGVMPEADIVVHKDNPLCGDRISWYLIVCDNILMHVSFEGTGCVISMGTTSLLSERIIQASCENVLNITDDDMLTMVGIPLGPVRLKCAVLSLKALHEGIIRWKTNV